VIPSKAPAASPAADQPSPDRPADELPENDGPPLKPTANPSVKGAPDVQPAAAKKSKTKSKPAQDKPATQNDAPDKPTPESGEDPLGIAEPAKAQTKGKGDEPPSIGDDPLGKFSEVLGSATDNPLPEGETPLADDKPLPSDTPADEAPARPSLPRPEPREVNVPARLDDPLPGIEAKEVPLADFLEALSDLSTIPITLEADGLGLVKASSASPVNLRATQTTVGQALEEALKPLQLHYAVLEDQLIVALPEPDGGKLQEYPVDDLTGKDDEQTQQLADWTTALIDPDGWSEEEPGAARLEPGPEVFTIHAANRTHAKLLFYFEKLRIARGLPLKSKHDAAFFKLQTRTAQVRERLAVPITLNFSRPTLLVQILGRLEESANVRILVDWRSLASLGWNPDGLGTLVVEKQPLESALDELLAPMELTWRAVDAQTLEVTSPAALAEKLELEFHPAGDAVADPAAGKALIMRLETALAMMGDEAGAGGLRFDPVSRCVLAALPQPQQRQVEKLLAEWSTEAKAAAR
jgi:hypothetical protein